MKTSRFISLLLCVVMIMSLFTGLAGSASADDVIVHEVQSGEIMLKICEKHGLNYYASKNAIMQLNGFTSEAQLAKLSVGQKIKLPASDAVASTVSTSTAVVTTTTAGGTTLTTTTSYVGTTAAGGNIAYYLTAYTVQAGDTLASICNKLGSNYYYYSPVILGINSLTNANYIRPGQVLLIPTPTAGGAGYAVVAHRVQAGETTTSICNRYGISYQAMRQLINGLNRRDNMDKIYPGQTVYVPTSAASAVATTVVSTGTTTTTTGTAGTSTAAASAGYTISFASGGAFASVNGKDYVTSAPAGSEVSIWSSTKAGYAVKSVDVVRLDTGAPVPVDYNYFTMPNSNVYVDVTYEKGLTITRAKAQGGSFVASVSGFITDAAFPGDVVTVLAYPNQYYSVSRVSYQKADGTVSAVDVQKDASGNYSFTMPSYAVKLAVTFAPTQYHQLSYSGVVGNGKVTFTVNNKEVKQAEQGETVTMKFVAEKNWVFNTTDFENSMAAHIPNKSSMGSFKKIDDTTYTFVMGTKDINVVGVQFLNRSSYTITGTVWKDTSRITNGSIHFNVIDQATGAITYNTKQAKFGDTVQVIYKPAKNYVPDTDYAKANSKGAGSALLAWSTDSSFTMPDCNVTVNARFIQDGSSYTYSALTKTLVPAAGGTVDFLVENCLMDNAPVGKVVTVKIAPKPNYDLSVARIIDGVETYAVTLNGKLVGDAPVTSNFIQVDKYTYTFVKRSGTDTIRVAFASSYLGVNATFTQVVEGGGDPAVEGIKGFAVNGNVVQGDAQVVFGDTVSFSVAVKAGYEITGIRKYIRDKSGPTEVPGTTAIIPGGKDNTYSYTVQLDDISAANSIVPPENGELVFEISCRKSPETYYTVKYSVPRIEGETPLYVDGTYADQPAIYKISAMKTSDGKPLPLDTSVADKADVTGIPGDKVESGDVMVTVAIPKNDVYVQKATQKLFYAFDKLLLNGSECSSVDSSDPDLYIASFALPKDTPDRILTTEVVYKWYKTEDNAAVKLDDLQFDGTSMPGLTDGVYSYTYNSWTTPLPETIDGTFDTAPDSAEVWVNDVLLLQDTDGDTTLNTSNANWLPGPNKLVIKISKAGAPDTVYTITVNYGLPASKLTKLDIDSKPVTPSVTDPMHPAEVTIYEATITKSPCDVDLDVAGSFVKATWELNGELLFVEDGTQTHSIDQWQVGSNTLRISVTENDGTYDLAPTTYVVNVNYAPEVSSLYALAITGYNGGFNFLEAGKYEYEIKVTSAPSDIDATCINATDVSTVLINGVEVTGSPFTGSWTISGETWNNGVGVSTLQITVKEDGKLPSTYLIRVTPVLDDSALDIYILMNSEMVKFKKLSANYTTNQETATIEIPVKDAADQVKVEINGVEQYPFTPGPATVDVKSGEKVEKWNLGNNVVKITVLESVDSRETVYTLNVKYTAKPMKLAVLTWNGVNSLSLNQSKSIKAASFSIPIYAEAEDPNADVTIRLNGNTGVTGTGNASYTFTETDADFLPDTVNYIDIYVTSPGCEDGHYHIDVNHKTP